MSWLPATVSVEPVSEPVTSTEAKLQCRVDGSDEDDLIDAYILASRQMVEQFTSLKLVSQTCVLRCSDWDDFCDLPIAPLISISSVKYLDPNGVEQTLSTDVYEAVLVGLDPAIRLKVNQSWPSIRDASDAIRVTAVAGYSTVPEPIRLAMLLCISDFYDGRSTGNVPDGAVSLLSNYRRF